MRKEEYTKLIRRVIELEYQVQSMELIQDAIRMDMHQFHKATADTMQVQIDYFFALLDHLGLKITHINEHDIVEKKDE